ncbi:bifunctional SulP family inorganic anion transporter/carbonic anhydrase [Streptomyces sp. NBC_01180]|uniref:bifunctional SulP family inorganic anion transporter/carbonic anhydrase n=1 Tax=Streptomyces sp. NBC_01180 TaxID=2903763 RepID=UPI00386EA900|nr:SulP family inorganic anion transporter [Streptomyces sp. NBC_01180]
MPACVPTRTEIPSDSSSARTRVRPSHGPSPSGDGARFRISGADLSASITVFLIAVPMSLGLAVAIGAPLEAGLLAAAVGGIVAGVLGGSALQVSGPSAGLTVVTAGLIQDYGWRTTCAITVGAGLLQLILGSLRTARSALAVSPAIVHGTLAGIGVAIALAQLHIVLGGTPQSSAVANALALPGQFARVAPAAPLIGLLTIAVLVLWPRIPGRTGHALRRIPAALASVAAATALAAVAAPGIARVDLPSWGAHALPEPPHGPVLGLLGAVFTVMLVASLESLLSAVAVDKLAADRPGATVRRADLDRELRGQGIANTVSGLLGGLPVSGGAVRGTANVRAGATGRASTVLHGVWILLAAGLLVGVLEWMPLAALAALVMVVGLKMVSYAHIRNVHRHREFLAYGATVAGVVGFGVLEGVTVGIAVAVGVALHRLARTRITLHEDSGTHRLRARGQLTFLAVPRLSRTLGQIPSGANAVVELDGSFMDHAAYETLQHWQEAHVVQGGTVDVTGRAGGRIVEPASTAPTCCRPWTPWRNHHCDDRALSSAGTGGPAPVTGSPGHGPGPVAILPGTMSCSAAPRTAVHPASTPEKTTPHASTARAHELHFPAVRYGSSAAAPDVSATPVPPAAPAVSAASAVSQRPGSRQLARGLSSFQRDTAPLVRDELARLAREGQQPSQLFLTCADSRLVTSMITSSGPGDLFTVRNVGNFVPLPGAEAADDSVAAAIEYAVEILRVESITVCGHSGCGAMTALLNDANDAGNTGVTDPARITDATAATDTADVTDITAATDNAPDVGATAASTPLRRWLRHGQPSLDRILSRHHPWARISGRMPADAVEQLCLTNVIQQLEHLRAHESVARRLAEGTLELHGMYFHVGEAQAYLLTDSHELDGVFAPVGPA